MSSPVSSHAVLLTPGAAASSAKGGANVSHFKLDNGMDVVVIPDMRTPVVTHMVWYKNGAADDPIGKSGIAHFLEHLMFKGTEKHKQGEFSNLVAELGGFAAGFLLDEEADDLTVPIVLAGGFIGGLFVILAGWVVRQKR